MENIKFPVYFATGYLIVYALIAQYEPALPFVPWLFFFSPFILLWMVYRVLKDGVASKKTFEESFYDDIDNEDL